MTSLLRKGRNIHFDLIRKCCELLGKRTIDYRTKKQTRDVDKKVRTNKTETSHFHWNSIPEKLAKLADRWLNKKLKTRRLPNQRQPHGLRTHIQNSNSTIPFEMSSVKNFKDDHFTHRERKQTNLQAGFFRLSVDAKKNCKDVRTHLSPSQKPFRVAEKI